MSEPDRPHRSALADPPTELTAGVRAALEEILRPHAEVEVAKVRQRTDTFEGAEVSRRLELALWLREPPQEPGDAVTRELITELMRPVRERTGIGVVPVAALAAQHAFERHGVVVFSRQITP